VLVLIRDVREIRLSAFFAWSLHGTDDYGSRWTSIVYPFVGIVVKTKRRIPRRIRDREHTFTNDNVTRYRVRIRFRFRFVQNTLSDLGDYGTREYTRRTTRKKQTTTTTTSLLFRRFMKRLNTYIYICPPHKKINQTSGFNVHFNSLAVKSLSTSLWWLFLMRITNLIVY